MKKIFLGLGTLCSTITAPFIISATSNEEYNAKKEEKIELDKKEKQMVEDYCLYDFIRLTGRFDTEIILSKPLYSRKMQLNHWIVLFKDKGYSIFDRSSQKIVEVNPNFITKDYKSNMGANITINPNIVFVRDNLVNFELHNLQNKDRLMIGDRRRTPKQKQQINYKYSTYKQPAENPARFKPYTEFKVDDLNKLKTEGINKPKEYGVRTSHLGLLYSDYEVDHSWFFKVYKTRHIGENDYKLYLPNSKYEWKGICGYLSMTALLLYAEYFVNSNYMGYSNASKYIKKINNYDVEIEYNELEMESEDYYGERIYNYDKYMYEKLWDHYVSLNESSKKEILVNEFIPHLNSQFYVDMLTSHEYYNGTTYWQRKRLINDFVYEQWKKGWVNYDLYGFRLKTSNFEYYLKEHKIPIEVTMNMSINYPLTKSEKIEGHAFIAYGLYNDDRLLTTYNWTTDKEKIDDMEWNQIILDQSVITGTMVLEDKSKEKVSLERYFWNGETHMTGPDMTKHLKKWGFIK